MKTKLLVMTFLALFGFIGHANSAMPSGLRIENGEGSTHTDPLIYINGPLYVVNNDSMKTASFPNLEFVNGPIYIVNNGNLTSVSFPNLKYVNGPIYVSYNSSLASVAYPKINFVNGPIYFYANKK